MKLLVFMILLTNNVVSYAICRDDIAPTTPSEQFVINDDNTVTDVITSLMWARCSVGQASYNGVCDSGAGIRMNWKTALQYVENINTEGFSGYHDWRLPNRKELASIIEYRCYAPSINEEIFPNTPWGAIESHWTSTPINYENTFQAWAVNFWDGEVSVWYHSGSSYIRMVRDVE